MAEVASMLASAIVKVASNKLGSAIGDQWSMQWSFQEDLEGMMATLETIGATLEDAERRSIKEKEVRLWLKRLRDAAYDISDMLDELQVNATPARGTMTGILSSVTSVTKKIAFANKMKKMREKLRSITEQHYSFGFRQVTTTNNDNQLPDPRKTSSKIDEAVIIGRDKEKKDIIVLLSTSAIKEETIILPIHGFGGMGKTTLAQLVFNDSQFFTEYHGKAWVYISQVFDLHKIGNSIISQLSKGEIQNLNDWELINQKLDELLCGGKILIVLDDLWEEDYFHLDKLKLMLNVGKKGSRVEVIVTTRSEGIANKICTGKPYKLEPLNESICWDIIKRRSGFESRCDKDQLEDIGLAIAKKCGGVALAAEALGYTLRFKDHVEWIAVRDSEVWDGSLYEDGTTPEKRVLQSLMLSYQCMPPSLRLCFAYCAIFPKGQNIAKYDLIHQWIALDFIKPSSSFSARELGEKYIMQLLGMSFLQQSKLLTASLKWYTMHDLVHDLAISVMGDELAVFDAAITTNNSALKYCRHALLKNYIGQKKVLSTSFPTKTRALRNLDSTKLELHAGAFSFGKCLRVLDFSECSTTKLPHSIGQLKQLRFLFVPRMQNETFPECIAELTNLQYLNLHGTSKISGLSESFGQLEFLLYLDLSSCSGILKLPESFGNLNNLLHLDLSGCSGISELPESFGNLKNLLHLELSGSSGMVNLPGSFGNLQNLMNLDLSGCSGMVELPGSFGNLNNLSYLDLSGCHRMVELPGTFGNLRNLLHFDLSRCSGMIVLPGSFGDLKNLLHLDLSGCSGMVKLPRSFKNLQSLVHLDLSSFRDVRGAMGALGGFTKLQYLNISNLGGNNHSSDWCGIIDEPDVFRNLSDLTYLNLSKCLDHLFVWVLSRATSDKIYSYMDRIGALTNLEHLDLSRNVSVKYLPDGLGNLKRLQTLDISGCVGLNTLPESLATINALKYILVSQCSVQLMEHMRHSRFNDNSVSLPLFIVRANDTNASSNIHQLSILDPTELKIRFLENVRLSKEACTVKLMDKHNLTKLTLSWTPDADRLLEDKELLGGLVPPRGLKHMELEGYSSVNFPAWLTNISHHLPNLVEVNIENLPRCRDLPPLGQLPNLRVLSLKRLHHITKIGAGLCGGKGAFSQLSKFSLWHMEGLEEWNTTYRGDDGPELFMFPMLEELEIGECPGLKLKPHPPIFRKWLIKRSDNVISSWGQHNTLINLPANIRHLATTNTCTRLEVCFSNVPMAEWRLLHHLPTLQELEIHSCAGLPCRPHGCMSGMASLRLLELSYCDNRVQMEWLGDLTSLESLSIAGCAGIKSLPRCISKLTKLRKLIIVQNPELKQWCQSEENWMMLDKLNTIYGDDYEGI